VDNHGFSFWVCELAGIYVVLFWTFKDFTLSLWTYKSPCGNVVDSPRFSFEFMDLQESLWFWTIKDFHLSLWTCSNICGSVLNNQGLSFEFLNL
jgi:hypothetical protein